MPTTATMATVAGGSSEIGDENGWWREKEQTQAVATAGAGTSTQLETLVESQPSEPI